MSVSAAELPQFDETPTPAAVLADDSAGVPADAALAAVPGEHGPGLDSADDASDGLTDGWGSSGSEVSSEAEENLTTLRFQILLELRAQNPLLSAEELSKLVVQALAARTAAATGAGVAPEEPFADDGGDAYGDGDEREWSHGGYDQGQYDVGGPDTVLSVGDGSSDGLVANEADVGAMAAAYAAGVAARSPTDLTLGADATPEGNDGAVPPVGLLASFHAPEPSPSPDSEAWHAPESDADGWGSSVADDIALEDGSLDADSLDRKSVV